MTLLHMHKWKTLEPLNYLDEANEDLRIYRLRRVGRRHLSFEQMWREWLERS